MDEAPSFCDQQTITVCMKTYIRYSSYRLRMHEKHVVCWCGRHRYKNANKPLALWQTINKSRVAESEFLGWSRIPKNTRSRCRIFCPTPKLHLNIFLHHTSKLGFLLKWYNLFSNFIETVNFCCAPRFLVIACCYKLLIAKLHSRYVKESEIFERLELDSDILSPTPQPW